MSKFHRYCSCLECKLVLTIQNFDEHFRSKHAPKIQVGRCKFCGTSLYTKKLFCDRSCSATYNNQHRSCKPGPKKGTASSKKFAPYTKIKQCVMCGKYHPRTGYTCSNICFSVYQSQRTKGKTGGWRNFGGNGEKGIYEGFVYQSSWELAWLMYHLDKNIPFRRCDEFFHYQSDGKMRKYYPDFYLINEQTYVEIKGFWSNNAAIKVASVANAGHTIKVLTKKEMLPYLEYRNMRSSYNGHYL